MLSGVPWFMLHDFDEVGRELRREWVEVGTWRSGCLENDAMAALVSALRTRHHVSSGCLIGSKLPY